MAEDIAHAVHGRAQAWREDEVTARNRGGNDGRKGPEKHGVFWGECGQGRQRLADVAQLGVEVVLDEEGVMCAGPFDKFGAPGCRQGAAVGILMAGGDDEGVEIGRGNGDAVGAGGDFQQRVAEGLGDPAQAG